MPRCQGRAAAETALRRRARRRRRRRRRRAAAPTTDDDEASGALSTVQSHQRGDCLPMRVATLVVLAQAAVPAHLSQAEHRSTNP